MKNPIKGLVQVTGEHDTGKTLFALTCGAQPSEIAFIDDDVKGRATVEQIGANKFAFYADFVKETTGMKELQIHAHGLELIRKAKAKSPKVLIWDTWTRFESTCHPFVVKHAGEFRDSWSPMGQIKGAEQWQVSFQYEAQIIESLLDAAPLVILVTHLKDHRIGAIKTGKQIPDAKKTLEEKSNLRLWLRHNPNSPAPIGLVLKRIAKVELSDDGLKTINVLPRKLNPCTWQKIFEYWKTPIGDREPEQTEKPDAFELSILDGTLTADQKEVLKMGAVIQEQEETIEFPNSSDEQKTRAQELSAQNKSKTEIAKILSDEFARAVTVGQVIKLLQ